MHIIGIKKFQERYKRLSNIPWNRQPSYEVCLMGVTQGVREITYVPKHLLDEEICMKALLANGQETLQYIPVEFQTSSFISRAINNRTDLFKNYRNLSDIVYLEMVKRNGKDLRKVPKHKRTEEIYLAAVKSSYFALYHIPKRVRNNINFYKICTEAVMSNPLAIGFIPMEYMYLDLCRYAIYNNPNTLDEIPIKHLMTILGSCSLEMMMNFIKHSGWVICYVPEKRRTEELCIIAFKNGYFHKHIFKYFFFRYSWFHKRCESLPLNPFYIGFKQLLKIRDIVLFSKN